MKVKRVAKSDVWTFHRLLKIKTSPQDVSVAANDAITRSTVPIVPNPLQDVPSVCEPNQRPCLVKEVCDIFHKRKVVFLDAYFGNVDNWHSESVLPPKNYETSSLIVSLFGFFLNCASFLANHLIGLPHQIRV